MVDDDPIPRSAALALSQRLIASGRADCYFAARKALEAPLSLDPLPHQSSAEYAIAVDMLQREASKSQRDSLSEEVNDACETKFAQGSSAPSGRLSGLRKRGVTAGEKRVRNNKMKDELGIQLMFPTIVEALLRLANGSMAPFVP